MLKERQESRETDNMAYTASGGKGLGKWFGFGKKKKFKQQGSTGSDESDEDGYQDPATIHSTEPPSFGRGPMPDYPPPRPNASPVLATRGQHTRPYSSIELGSSTKGATASHGGRHASVLNNKTEHSRTIDSRGPSRKDNSDDYFEPFDARNVRAKDKPQVKPKPLKLQTSVDSQDSRNGKDNYCEPWDTAKPASPTVKIPDLKDDYVDPWDSQNPGTSPKSSYEEDDDYTVPYDSGKGGVIEMLSKQPQKGSIDQEDEIYDMPYEEGENNPQSQSNGVQQRPQVPGPTDTYDEPWEWNQKAPKVKQPAPVRAPPPPPSGHKLREKQSSTDTSPIQDGNYDAPWDWKEKAAKEAIAKKFSNSDPPVFESPRGSVSSPVNPIPKPGRPNKDSSQPELPKEYEVDPTIPLENQAWYHGLISRVEAEGHLKGMPDCSYLIRNSESSKIDFSLSLKNNNNPMHLKISCRDGKFILGQHSRPYDSIPEMIHHYSLNNLNIRGAERVRLIYPVLQESMYYIVEPGT